MVELLPCRARGLGFESGSHHLDFRDWVSLLSSLDMTEILLERRKSSKQSKPSFLIHVYT